MDAANLALSAHLVSSSYVGQGGAALAARRKLIKQLLSNRKLPQSGWDEATIEMLLQDCALMDSNTFPGQAGLGEREGRVACPMVARMHARLAHGIGRSGDIAAEQPKAAGSSLLAKLAAHLAGDALDAAGLLDMALPLVLPCATGMALTLVMLAAAGARGKPQQQQQQQQRQQRQDQQQQAKDAPRPSNSDSSTSTAAEWQAACQKGFAGSGGGCSSSNSSAVHRNLPQYVIWSRIDQKTCLKSITAANLLPVVIELQQQGDQLVTDVAGIQAAVEQLGAEQVAAVVTTASCFAPRSSDDVVAVAKLCQQYNVPHIINNAYGVQAKPLTAAVTAACRKGRVDAIVQSTDKNFMVPVGGSVVAAPKGQGRDWLIQAVAKNYPGRASMTAHLDLLVTLLHWGTDGWTRMLSQREEVYIYLAEKLSAAAQQIGERVLLTPQNPISLALTLDGLAAAAAATNAAADGAAFTHSSATGTAGDGTTSRTAAAEDHHQQPYGKCGGRTATGRADVTFLGSMLWARNVSGTRVLTSGKQQTVGGITFADYGCNISGYPHPYITAAAALGTTQQDVDVFVVRLVKAYRELKDKWTKAATGTDLHGAVHTDAEYRLQHTVQGCLNG